jgi:hypothetical protein
MPITEAQKKATSKYVKNNYDRHVLTMPKGKKADLQDHAAGRGESLNGFVNRAIDNQIKCDIAFTVDARVTDAEGGAE